MFRKELLLVLGAVFCLGFAVELPSEYKICKASESDINECLKNAIEIAIKNLAKGLPSYDIATIEPLTVPNIVIGEGKGVVHVVQKFENAKYYGISQVKIDKVESKITDTVFDLNIEASVENVKMDASYELDGRILVLPIVGKGASTIILKDMKVHVNFHSEIVERKGESYADVKEFKLTFKPGDMHFDFQNLFNGDDKLSTEMHKVLNENWSDIWNDVGAGYEEALSLIMKEIASQIFRKTPYKKLLN